uniref:protein ILRUN-like isoform X2 n=1 Tax=Styela clava TaxID=7725 RepID=UPI00193A57D8|nr:protein ILRUN-like isoform X2 [Styela clava]
MNAGRSGVITSLCINSDTEKLYLRGDSKMEVSSDSEMDSIENSLLSRFQAMGTTDKDVLISQFQSLLGFQLNPAGCAFFLDMTNWNLQSAIGAYYDFEGAPQSKLPSMTFILDVTVGEGESVPPNTTFVKTWRVQNSGKEEWPPGCSLRFLGGEKMGTIDSVSVPTVPAGQTTDISINLRSPVEPGVYQGRWRMYNTTGTPFGDIIWVIISVKQDGLLDITQQISRVSCDFGEGASVGKNDQFSSQNMNSMETSPEDDMACDDPLNGLDYYNAKLSLKTLCHAKALLTSKTNQYYGATKV